MVATLAMVLWVQEEAQPNVSFKEQKLKERDMATSSKPLLAVVDRWCRAERERERERDFF